MNENMKVVAEFGSFSKLFSQHKRASADDVIVVSVGFDCVPEGEEGLIRINGSEDVSRLKDNFLKSENFIEVSCQNSNVNCNEGHRESITMAKKSLDALITKKSKLYGNQLTLLFFFSGHGYESAFEEYKHWFVVPDKKNSTKSPWFHLRKVYYEVSGLQLTRALIFVDTCRSKYSVSFGTEISEGGIPTPRKIEHLKKIATFFATNKGICVEEADGAGRLTKLFIDVLRTIPLECDNPVIRVGEFVSLLKQRIVDDYNLKIQENEEIREPLYSHPPEHYNNDVFIDYSYAKKDMKFLVQDIAREVQSMEVFKYDLCFTSKQQIKRLDLNGQEQVDLGSLESGKYVIKCYDKDRNILPMPLNFEIRLC